MESKITKCVPSSFLQKNNNATIIVDGDAASLL